ncbi:hypothetical protein [Rhodanobacter sp. FW106-PBR-R2A-1-13]|uniref:hypothetical protein n=1 Tax=Rhodanobacter sp. FW106-PBR-R2A-1-13 TaxID=3454845 RepID=UPI0034E3F779
MTLLDRLASPLRDGDSLTLRIARNGTGIDVLCTSALKGRSIDDGDAETCALVIALTAPFLVTVTADESISDAVSSAVDGMAGAEQSARKALDERLIALQDATAKSKAPATKTAKVGKGGKGVTVAPATDGDDDGGTGDADDEAAATAKPDAPVVASAPPAAPQVPLFD